MATTNTTTEGNMDNNNTATEGKMNTVFNASIGERYSIRALRPTSPSLYRVEIWIDNVLRSAAASVRHPATMIRQIFVIHDPSTIVVNLDTDGLFE